MFIILLFFSDSFPDCEFGAFRFLLCLIMARSYCVFVLDVVTLKMVACRNYGIVAIVFDECVVHSWTRGVI